MFEPKKILVPTDFSKYSDTALKQAVDMARTYHSKIYLLHVRRGVPYDEILKEQSEKGADLIVMGTHGKTGFIKHIMGSVTQKVLGGTKSPVLLAKE